MSENPSAPAGSGAEAIAQAMQRIMQMREQVADELATVRPAHAETTRHQVVAAEVVESTDDSDTRDALDETVTTQTASVDAPAAPADLTVPAQKRHPRSTDLSDLRLVASHHLDQALAQLSEIRDTARSTAEAIAGDATSELDRVARGNLAAIERERDGVRLVQGRLADLKDTVTSG